MKMTESTKWPEHIEECLKASIEHGPGARFSYGSASSILYGNNISSVIFAPTANWEYIAPRPLNTEEWGNEYVLQYGLFSSRHKTIVWYKSIEDANFAETKSKDKRIAFHHRILEGTTGETLRFSTLKVFK